MRQRRPRFRAAARIADQGRELADHEDDGVAEVLEVLHLPDQDGVAQVQIWRGRIESHLDRQLRAGLLRPLQFGAEVSRRAPRRRSPWSGRRSVRQWSLLWIMNETGRIGNGCISPRRVRGFAGRRTAAALAACARRSADRAGSARSAEAARLTLRMPLALPESARLSRRTLLQGLGVVALGTAAGTAAHGFLYERHHIELTEQTLDVAGWPSSLAGLRIGFLTDLHRSTTVSHQMIARAVDLVMAHQPDLIVVGRRLRDQPRSPVRPARGRGARRAVRSLRRLCRARQPRRREGNVGGLDRCGLRGAEGCADAD